MRVGDSLAAPGLALKLKGQRSGVRQETLRTVLQPGFVRGDRSVGRKGGDEETVCSPCVSLLNLCSPRLEAGAAVPLRTAHLNKDQLSAQPVTHTLLGSHTLSPAHSLTHTHTRTSAHKHTSQSFMIMKHLSGVGCGVFSLMRVTSITHTNTHTQH